MATIDEQIAQVDADILAASKASNIRDGEKSITRQGLADLRALRASLVQRKNATARRSQMTFIQIEDD